MFLNFFGLVNPVFGEYENWGFLLYFEKITFIVNRTLFVKDTKHNEKQMVIMLTYHQLIIR